MMPSDKQTRQRSEGGDNVNHDFLTGEDLPELVSALTPEDLQALVDTLPPAQALALLDVLGDGSTPDLPAASPEEQALTLDEGFRIRPQLTYLSERIANAVKDVENGVSRRLIIQMPPRSGKTTMTTLMTPAWIMAKHPTWPIALTSHDGALATSWGRQIRRWAEGGSLGPAVSLAADAGAAGAWETTAGGKLLSISIRESFTGRGAKCLFIDDPHKDFVDAHSSTMRDNVWDWWLSVAQTRLEPPSIVLVCMTRWHQDDLIGRLLSDEYEGDPNEWEVIKVPAIAEVGDQIGREVGEPLISPLIDETSEESLVRWAAARRASGEYVWSAMMQQRPSPAKGAIFDASWWPYWTVDPAKATDDGRVVYLDPSTLGSGRWLDSWDCTFKATDSSDFVVGQRWVRSGANRYLIAQIRGRLTFTQTIERMKFWATDSSPYGRYVHQRLIESAANGPAIIDTLKDQISGIKPVIAKNSKEARARAVTPEIESGNVYLPHPTDPGNEWVAGLLSELRNFPHDANDDQCLVGETLVETPDGARRLDSIVPGDVVAGMSGWVDVLESGQTGVSEVVTRRGVTGTAGHPVWTGRGWVPLADIRDDESLWMFADSQTVRGGTEPPVSPTAVYNLTTSDGTFFANGVLTHNCDALTQALAELRESGRGGITVPGDAPSVLGGGRVVVERKLASASRTGFRR